MLLDDICDFCDSGGGGGDGFGDRGGVSDPGGLGDPGAGDGTSGGIDCSDPSNNCSVTVTMVPPSEQPSLMTNSCTEVSILCRMANPQQCPDCGAIFNSASDMLTAGAIYTSAAWGAIFGGGEIGGLFAEGSGSQASSVVLNIGGEGEVPGAVNVQGPWIFDSTWASSSTGQSFTELQAAGNQFVVADNTALPFADSSVQTVITNNVPIDTTTWLGPGVQSSEILRILASGGSWVNNGSIIITLP